MATSIGTRIHLNLLWSLSPLVGEDGLVAALQGPSTGLLGWSGLIWSVRIVVSGSLVSALSGRPGQVSAWFSTVKNLTRRASTLRFLPPLYHPAAPPRLRSHRTDPSGLGAGNVCAPSAAARARATAGRDALLARLSHHHSSAVPIVQIARPRCCRDLHQALDQVCAPAAFSRPSIA